MATPDKAQVEQGQRLQKLLLDEFERMLTEGTMNPTDRSTLVRFLKDNGWTIDPSMLPDSLKGMVKLPAVDEEIEKDRVASLPEYRASKQA